MKESRIGPQEDHSSRSVILVLLLVAVVYLSTIHLQPRGFWIVDNANKFLQVQSILRSNFSDYSLPWKGQQFDPEFRFNPLPSFSVVENGRLYSIYSPFFALISTGPYRIFGFRELAAIPFFSSLLLLIAVAKIIRMATPNPRAPAAAVLITALATPVWFYSTVFWEHVCAAAAAVWCVYYFLRANREGRIGLFAMSGALSTLSCFFREEYALFILALVLVMGPPYKGENRVKAAAVFILAAMVTISLFFLFQFYATGNAFGFHVSSLLGSEGSFISYLTSRFAVFYNLVIASYPSQWVSFLLSAPFFLLLFVSPKRADRSSLLFQLLLSLTFLSSLAYLYFSWVNPRPGLFLLESANSFFVSAPILALACWRGEEKTENDIERPLRLIAILFIVFYCLAAPKLASRGIHWANRFLFIAYPLASLIAALRLERLWKMGSRYFFRLGLGLVLLSMLLQLYSIRLLYQKTAFSVTINTVIQQSPEEVVVSDVWWAPQELYSAFFQKAFFYVRSQQEYNFLIKKLSSKGIRKFLVVTQPKPGLEGETCVDKELGYFSLQFVRMSNVSGE